MSDPCPCGSGTAYAACCGPFHAGGDPATAEQLMRARYAAYARGDAAFLIRTEHPVRRARMRVQDLRTSFALTWLGLEILERSAGGPDDAEGMVRFRARFRVAGGSERLHEERSRFCRDHGAWVYRDADG